MSKQFPRNPLLESSIVRIAMVPSFSALSLATNYAMIDLWNIKLMDAFIFLAAFLFGLEVGLGSAILTWGVYGFVNPYGQDDLILLLFLMVGESFYAIAGALLSRTSIIRDLVQNNHRYKRASFIFGIIGFQATFAYDLLTNFGSWLFKTASLYQALITGVIVGAPFSILHEASNLVFFSTVVPMSIVAVKRLGLTQEKSV